MTTPDPKPLIAPCPNPECRGGTGLYVYDYPVNSDHGCETCKRPPVMSHGCFYMYCPDCDYHGPIACSDGPSQEALDKARAEAIRLHNLICRPHSGQTPAEVRAQKSLSETLERDGLCVCRTCWHMGTGSEFTVSNYPADDYSACCPVCGEADEDQLVSVESLSDSLRAFSGMARRPGDKYAESLVQTASRRRPYVSDPSNPAETMSAEKMGYGPLLTFAIAFMDGWLQDERQEVRNHWKHIRAELSIKATLSAAPVTTGWDGTERRGPISMKELAARNPPDLTPQDNSGIPDFLSPPQSPHPTQEQVPASVAVSELEKLVGRWRDEQRKLDKSGPGKLTFFGEVANEIERLYKPRG